MLTLVDKPSLFRWTRWTLLGGFLYPISQTVLYYPPKNPLVALCVGTNVVVDILRLIDALCLSDLRLVGQTVPAQSLDLWFRIKWAVQLRVSPRGLGWQYEPTHAIPSAPANESRLKFVLRTTSNILWGILCLDIIGLLSVYQPPNYLMNSPLWNSFRHVLQLWGNLYYWIGTGHSILAVIFVSFHINSPRAWPPILGPLSEAYTVKKFWGRTWHQIIRKPLTSPWRAQANLLGIKSGTKLYYYLVMYGAFIISGIAHQVGVFTATHQLETQAIRLFLSQAIAISLEDIISILIKKIGVDATDKKHIFWWKWLGHLWVFIWLAQPMWNDSGMEEGFVFACWRISPILGIFKGMWFPNKSTTI